MNELQRKLARRRTLNGEGDATTDAAAAGEPVVVSPPQPVVNPQPKINVVPSKWSKPNPGGAPTQFNNRVLPAPTVKSTPATEPVPSETSANSNLSAPSNNIRSTPEVNNSARDLVSPVLSYAISSGNNSEEACNSNTNTLPIVSETSASDNTSEAIPEPVSVKNVESINNTDPIANEPPLKVNTAVPASVVVETHSSETMTTEPTSASSITPSAVSVKPEKHVSILPVIESTSAKADDADTEFFISKPCKSSKSGQSLFDDLLSSSDDLGIKSNGNANFSRSIRPNESSIAVATANAGQLSSNNHSIAVAIPKSSGDDELEALEKLIQDTDHDVGLDSLNIPAKNGSGSLGGRVASSIRIKKPSNTSEDDSNLIESFGYGSINAFDELIDVSSVTPSDSIRSDSASQPNIASPKLPGTHAGTQKRSSFSTQKTNIKSWMNTLRLDPSMSVHSLFSDDNNEFPSSSTARKPLDYDISTPATSSKTLEYSRNQLIDESNAMDLLLSNKSDVSPLGLGPGKSIRDHLVGTSFVGMDSTETLETEKSSRSTNSNRLFSKLEDHGLCSNDEPGASVAIEGMESGLTSTPPHGSMLFKDNVTETIRKEKKAVEELSYEAFMDRIVHPQCHSLRGVIRRFVSSIMGPNNDGVTPPDKKLQVDYVFKGITDLVRRCSDFFEAMQEHFAENPLWKKDSEEQLVCSRDHLERFVMSKIADIAFAVVETPEEDAILSRRMQLLSFLEPDVLDIKPGLRNDMVWAIAMDELRKMNIYKTPDEKVACVVKSASILFRSLNLARAKTEDNPEESGLGADDFLPAFIYVVLKSNVPRLQSNCEYIQCFHNPTRLMSKSGYCFVNLRSAIEFILSMDATSISIDADYFERKMVEGEELLNSS